ncbi:ABC transporter substrate-binding protein [Microbacterium immunditiarum]|uniref:Branched-chain amino acid transport system substrate-binding protein n=1 Tax=Microbacterium immunditiarum TaxID=337480 RepID=A0A7Y9GRV2_9MICO|nr:ABC transporter substrate-binding protein [Microbacterium immunditiarum]NYE21540.1 branched-chain amino acid transport system substrate-binding protein [Microbacterium immunditiarum]
MTLPSRAHKALLTTAAVLALGLVLSGCTGRGSSASAEPDGPTPTAAPGAVDVADCENYQPSQGISDDEIKLGATYPDSGPLANIGAVARGMKAYFEHLNATEGGIDGRTITFIGKDDQYDPTKAVSNTNELLQEEQVFAMVGIQSSAGTTSVWDQLNAECVPILLSTVGGEPMSSRLAHLNTTDGLVPYASDAYGLATHAIDTWQSQKVGILALAGALQDAFTAGVTAGLEGTDAELTLVEAYQVGDPTVTAQITNLKAAGVDTVILAGAGATCPQAINGIRDADWQPHILVSFTCSVVTHLADPVAADGVVSGTNKVPLDESSPEYEEFVTAAAEYAPGEEPSIDMATGWLQAQLIAEILRSAPALTRVDVINQALNLKDVTVPMAAPGITFNTSATDPIPFESVRMQQFNGGSRQWEHVDADVIDLDGVLASLEG